MIPTTTTMSRLTTDGVMPTFSSNPVTNWLEADGDPLAPPPDSTARLSSGSSAVMLRPSAMPAASSARTMRRLCQG